MKEWLRRVMRRSQHGGGEGKLVVHQVERRLVCLVPIAEYRGHYTGRHLGVPA